MEPARRGDVGAEPQPSPPTSTAPPSAAGTTPHRLHHFHPAFHHPVVHALQHTISPLSGSLLIFGIHKAWQLPAALASVRAALEVARSPGPRLSRAAALLYAPSRGGLLFTLAAGAALAVSLVAASSLAASAARTRQRRKGAGPAAEQDADKASLAELYEPDDVPLVARAVSQWPTSALVSSALCRAQGALGLPWWATIAGATVLVRAALVPLNVGLLRNSLRMKVLLPELRGLGAILAGEGAGAGGGPAAAAARLAAANRLRHLFAAHGCSPFAHALSIPVLLPPLILSFFGAVHSLAMGVSAPGMADGGALWFPDLMERDETQLLPILSSLTWLWQLETGAGMHYRSMPTVRLVARTVALASIPLAATLPSGVFVFWVTSNLFAVGRGYALRPDAVRRALRIPLRRETEALEHHVPKYVGY